MINNSEEFKIDFQQQEIPQQQQEGQIQDPNAEDVEEFIDFSDSIGFNIRQQLKKAVYKGTYAIQFKPVPESNLAVAALSDFSLLVFDAGELKPVFHIPKAHNKKIQDIHVVDNHLLSVSNDGALKIWDLNAKKHLVKTYKSKQNSEYYSVSQAKQMIACGSEGQIDFWDTTKGGLVTSFNETHPDEISSVQFFPNKANLLLSGSIDGMVCLFDLTKENEEDAAESVLVLDQPICRCKFFSDEHFNTAYATTTANSISLLSLEQAKSLRNISALDNLEFNTFQLIDAHPNPQSDSMGYTRANLDGLIEEYIVQGANEPALVQKYQSKHKGPVTASLKLSDELILTSGEDGNFLYTQKFVEQQVQEINFDQQQDAFFFDDNSTQESGFAGRATNTREQRWSRMDRKPF